MTLLNNIFKNHLTAVLTALFVGILAVAPQIIFIFSLGEEYRGLPMLQTPNEMGYLSIMKEIADGHFSAASPTFFEYKDALPLLPPTIPFFYAAFSWLFGAGLVNVIILSKFFLPAILFLLVYWLVYRLAGESSWQAKLNAIAGGLLVVLGFDLVDYRTWWKFLLGQGAPDNFLIWTRPVNPIAGAVLLFIFWICLWELSKIKKKSLVFVAGASLALMMASYVFSWTLALAVLGFLIIFDWLVNQKENLKYYLGILSVGTVFSLPYWLAVFRASKLPGYSEAAARMGFLATHQPHFNKFIIFAFLIFAIFSIWNFYKTKKMDFGAWWRFCLALLLGSLLAFNQQVITGKEIWYYHYIFYTIPAGYLVILLVLWNFLRPIFTRTWFALVSLTIFFSLMLGIYTQASVYNESYNFYKSSQPLMSVAEFLNEKAKKDCVVLTTSYNNAPEIFVTAFTHCNAYFSGERFVIAPAERFIHNYLAYLRINGISSKDVDSYLAENKSEAAAFLYSQLQYSLGYPDPKFDALYQSLPSYYRDFMRGDFRAELMKYKIDYIWASKPLTGLILAELEPIERVLEVGEGVLYELKPL